MFQHNIDILKQAVKSYADASDIMAVNMIIIDNSVDKEATKEEYIAATVKEVLPTPNRLNFPQLHNFMADTALNRRLEFYFWAHSDNYVLPGAADRDLGKDVISCLREQINETPSWAGVFYSYDHLMAYRTQALVQVPWDPHVFQYGSECDEYGRLREAGYIIRSCKVHLSFDMKRVVDISASDSFDEKKRKLEAESDVRLGRNQWREGAMSEAERESRTAMKLASREYLKSKWGELTCNVRGLTCSKAWPVCPICPPEFPDCYNKNQGWEDLAVIRTRQHYIFDNDANQPLTPAA